MTLEKPEGKAPRIMRINELAEEVLHMNIQNYLTETFNKVLSSKVIGRTECAFERINEEDAIVKTYALVFNLGGDDNITCQDSSKKFIDYFSQYLYDEIGGRNILIRRPPESLLEDGKLKLTVRLAICPDGWDKDMYNTHYYEQQNKFNKGIDTE